MDQHLYDIWQQAWRVVITLLVPTMAIPLASVGAAFMFGVIGVRDSGVLYAVRLVVLIGLGMLCAPMVADSLVALMSQALR